MTMELAKDNKEIRWIFSVLALRLGVLALRLGITYAEISVFLWLLRNLLNKPPYDVSRALTIAYISNIWLIFRI